MGTPFRFNSLAMDARLTFGSTKTHAERDVPLSPSLAGRMAEHLEAFVDAAPDALVFTSSTRHPIRHRNFYRRVWEPTLEHLHLPHAGMHSLRHSAAARMIGAGWPAKAVQQTLGHRSAAFTLTVYGHLFESDLDDLAALLDDSGAEQAPNKPATGTVAVLRA